MFKKIISAALIAAMAAGLSSCGKNAENSQVPKIGEDGKKIVEVYALYTDDDFEMSVIDFNKKSSEYRVEVTKYGKEYPDDPLTRLNNDIIAGKIPDVIMLHPYMPIDSYISKGFLADLYGYMDNDGTVSRADFLEGVMKAYETNGCLYELVPSFSISTLAGKVSRAGSDMGWTVDEFIRFADENHDKNIIGDEYTLSMIREDFFRSVTNLCYENFIDREKGECSFASDDFIRLMEFTDRFPREIDREQINANSNNYWNDYYKAYRDGETLLKVCTIGNFDSIRTMEMSLFTTPIVLKGYPGVGGNGAVFNAHFGLAITAKASNSEGAWEFLKYFLSDEYQDKFAKNDSERFPVKVSAVEKAAAASEEVPYYIDDNGSKIFEKKTVWNGLASVNIGVNTDEDTQNIIGFINSVENISRYDSRVNDIINEEAAMYFSGQRPAAETAEIIQNRVQNYLNEQM